jgi:hypothetical protein
MQADSLYPRGFHPVRQAFLPDNIRTPAPVVPRLSARSPVKYYFVDFSTSVKIPIEKFPKLVTGADGLGREAPELSSRGPYDPFKLDIFMLGSVYQKEIYTVRDPLLYETPGLYVRSEILQCSFHKASCPFDDQRRSK